MPPTASGEPATASGEQTTASGEQTTASGEKTSASGEGTTASVEQTTASGEKASASGEATTASGEHGAPPSQDQICFGAFGFDSPEVKAFVTDVATKANELEGALTSRLIKSLMVTTRSGVNLLQTVPVKTENAFRTKMQSTKTKLAAAATSLNNILSSIGPDQQKEDLRGGSVSQGLWSVFVA